MKKTKYLLLLTMFLSFVAMNSNSFAQVEPVLYFCERYDAYEGEIGVRDRYSKGPLTVVVKSEFALNLESVAIQFDRYNFRSNEYEFYKKFYFIINKEDAYVYFAKNEESDMEFEYPGFYRVFLLDENDQTVTSGLVEIIE